MKMKYTNIAALALIAFGLSAMNSCINPTPNAGYYSLDASQAEANRRNTNRIQQEDRDMDHVERMREAEATEVATRHAPTSVSRTTVIAPSLWW